MEILSTLTPYHWIALGLILLCAEMLGAAGFLIGAAVAAIAMGVLTALVGDLSATVQFSLYAAAAITATLLYFKLFREASLAYHSNGAPPKLNKASHRLIGHTFELDHDIGPGNNKVQIGDTMWRVRADEPLSKGVIVEVIDASEMSLVIAPR